MSAEFSLPHELDDSHMQGGVFVKHADFDVFGLNQLI